jgi:small multidrug resistance family-3 protein
MVEPLEPLEDANIVIATLGLFFLAAIMEISGGYLVWQWIKEKKSILIGLTGGIVLFLYGIIPTIQPSHFGRTYAAYGGIFIVSLIVWGIIVDKKKPDRFEIIGSLIAICGAIIILYSTLGIILTP